MHGLQPAFFLAKKMGKGMGRGKILQRSLPQQQGEININSSITLCAIFCYNNK